MIRKRRPDPEINDAVLRYWRNEEARKKLVAEEGERLQRDGKEQVWSETGEWYDLWTIVTLANMEEKDEVDYMGLHFDNFNLRWSKEGERRAFKQEIILYIYNKYKKKYEDFVMVWRDTEDKLIDTFKNDVVDRIAFFSVPEQILLDIIYEKAPWIGRVRVKSAPRRRWI